MFARRLHPSPHLTVRMYRAVVINRRRELKKCFCPCDNVSEVVFTTICTVDFIFYSCQL